MRIIHYIFGMPPLRGGGAIKYAMDLAEMQVKLGHDVFLVYPGVIKRTTDKVAIKKNAPYGKVKVYEIINALPVSLVTGIKEIEPFVKKADKSVYKRFLKQERVEILHLHSLMGLHVELLEAAKECGVRILFTTHDYFGVCPKTNLLYRGQICEDYQWTNCRSCCADAEDVSTLIRRQTHWFQFLIRCKMLVKLKHFLKLRKSDVGENIRQEEKKKENVTENDEKVFYKDLRQYYIEEYSMIDVMLYNSSVAKEQYEKRIRACRYIIIGGMHKEIFDGRKYKKYNSVIRFAYLGYPVEYKGYYMLIQAFDRLNKKYCGQFELNMYMEKTEYERGYIRLHKQFRYENLEKVYDEIDMLVVPSICAETYGLVVLEALSFGVPVVVTSCVGAKDLLVEDDKMGYIIEPTQDALYNILEKVLKDRSILPRLNKGICDAQMELNYEEYVKKILTIYEQV